MLKYALYIALNHYIVDDSLEKPAGYAHKNLP